MSDVVEKVRDLFRLAERAGTEHEASAALAAALRLMDKHRIERAEIESRQAVPSVEPVTRDAVGPSRWRIPPWERALFSALCEVNDCAPMVRGHRASNRTLVALGTVNDVRAVAYMHAYAVRAIEDCAHADAERERDAGRRPASGNWRTWHSEYRIAAAIRIAHRVVEAARQNRSPASPGAALVLSGARERANQEAARCSTGVAKTTLHDHHGKDVRARYLGDAAGRHVDIGRSAPALGSPAERLP